MYGTASLTRFAIDYNQTTRTRILLDPGSIVEGNRLGDLIGSLGITGGSGYAFELLPIVNTNDFVVTSAAVSANTVFDSSITNQVGLFVRAVSDVSSVDAYFDVLTASGMRKWRLDEFGAEILGQPDLEDSVWGDSANPDSDAFPNLDEYLADTLPRDSNSVLRVESLEISGGSMDPRG